jgi:ABC-type multidrug transport system ATPase subunit
VSDAAASIAETAAPETAPILVTDKVNQFYGSSHTLRDVSFDVPTGGVTALLGRNGVGKTTLLKCLMGVVPVRGGSITFDGQDITAMPSHLRVRRGIGYVPQGREIFPRLSVEENLLMGLASKVNGASRDIPGEVFNLKIEDYLQFSREFNAQCPAFETDNHGLVEEKGPDGNLRYFADCVKA